MTVRRERWLVHTARRLAWLPGPIQVPMRGDRTREDPTLVDPAERLRRFGQEDHVRYCGLDLRDRLEEAGFRVRVVAARDVADRAELQRFRLREDDVLFHCEGAE